MHNHGICLHLGLHIKCVVKFFRKIVYDVWKTFEMSVKIQYKI